MPQALPQLPALAEIYADAVKDGERTIDKVPELIRAEVAEILKGGGQDDRTNSGD